MKPKWWTCGCGTKNMTCLGTPVCDQCGRPAAFTIPPPKEQTGFEFTTEEEKDAD